MPIIGTPQSKIGLRPGIGLYGEYTYTLPFTVDSLLVRPNQISPFSIDSHVSTLASTVTFTVDTNIITGTYTSDFTIDCELRKLLFFTIDSVLIKQNTLPFTIDTFLANTIDTATFTIDALVSNLRTSGFTVDSYILCVPLLNFTIDCRLARQCTNPFTIDSRIAVPTEKTFAIDSRIANMGQTKSFTVDSSIANNKALSWTIDCLLYRKPYYELGGIDVSKSMLQPTWSGLEVKSTKYSPYNSIFNTIYRQGVTNLKGDFELIFLTEATRDAFLGAVNSQQSDLIFYHGRSDWFVRVKHINVVPIELKHVTDYYKVRVKVELEDPYQYHVMGDFVDLNSVALPYVSNIVFNNQGTEDAPFYSLAVSGRYYSGSHTKSVRFHIMDGATEESSMLISDELLSDEVATLDLDGKLTCVYTDNFIDNTRFTQDVYAASNASVSSGSLNIASGGYVTYKLYGPHPTLNNIRMTANITKMGSSYVQVSDDNTSWYTAVPTTDITSGSREDYYLDYSEKLSVVYIRFNCPVGSTMSINDLVFTAERDTSYYDIPVVKAGTSRTMKLSDATSSSHYAGINAVFRSRKWAA